MKTAANIPLFFLLTFAFSWIVWGGMLMYPPSGNWYIPMLFLGAFGPSLVAIFLVHTGKSPDEIKDFWIRLIDLRRIGWKWLLFIFLIFPAILLIGYSILNLLGQEFPDFFSYFSGLNTPEAVALFLIFMLLGGPLAEELGWRGYVLDPLQERWGKFKASMILGFFWSVWHLPLFFIEGTSQHQKGFGVAFWSWSLQILVLSVIFTWIYNHTRKSILAAVLLHFMANFAYPLGLDSQDEIIFSVVRIMLILPILYFWHKSSASKRKVPVPVNLS
jgi:uncharacterized protein